ncbi:MAG: methyl-accepting chemotaxis protein [Lachnospiraceae bacterium]|nr:methyl-accepting chemotaxis protein [Lachnospiraceae bacterium]
MLKKLGIRAKMLIVVLPLAIMICILATFMWVGELTVLNMAKSTYYDELKMLTDKLITADRDFYQAMLAQEEIYINNKRGDTATVAENQASYQENSQQVLDGLDEIEAIMQTDEYLYREFRMEGNENNCEQIIANTRANFAKWKEAGDRENMDEAADLFADARAGLNDMEDLLEVYTAHKDSELKSYIYTMVIIALVVIFIIFVILAILTVYVLRYIRKSIEKISSSLGALANGRFEPVSEEGLHNDELSNMIRDTNSLITRLGNIIGDIKSAVETVDHSSTDLAETADQISSTTEGITEAVNGIAQGAVQQAEEIQNANVNVDTIAEAVMDGRNYTQSLDQTATNMNEDSKQAADELEKLGTSSREMSERISEITSRINATSAAVAGINEKVAAITSIATQTNLLALNASIEAARAGEAGRGFAVVAEEIGKLADDSANSAAQIREQMEALVSESQAAVETASEVQKSNTAQQEVINNTVESISKLIAAIETTVSGVRSIESGAQACQTSKDVVVDVMSSLSAISEENAASTEETSASMQELAATVSMLAQSAENLKALAAELTEDVSFFK